MYDVVVLLAVLLAAFVLAAVIAVAWALSERGRERRAARDLVGGWWEVEDARDRVWDDRLP